MATVKQLNYLHNEYLYYAPIWQTIADIREGATAFLKKGSLYLPKRPGEDLELYNLRLRKLSFTPVASNAIREFCAELASAPRSLENAQDTFWEKFRDSTDGKGRDEDELLNLLFSSLLYFGRIYVACDRPKLGIRPRTLLESKDLNNLPYLTIYEPLSVINWGDGWFITKQLLDTTEPLQEPSKVIKWTLWDKQNITVYQTKVKLNDYGEIDLVYANGRYRFPDDPQAIIEPEVTPHGLGICPMTYMKLPVEMWTGNNIFLKQLQHFLIESSWTDAGTMAGIIQRVYTPLPPTPSDDPRVTFEEPDYSKVVSSNAHILVGSDFKFQESPGNAIANLTNQLEVIESQIKNLVSMGYASGKPGVLQQSGLSKEIDRSTLRKSMKAYGTKVAQLYQDCLILVARLGNKPDNISFSGLDSYGSDTLESILDVSERLETVVSKLPPTALKLWYGKLANLLAGVKSNAVKDDIAKELDDIFSSLDKITETGDSTKNTKDT